MFDFHYQIGGARRKLFRSSGDVCSIGSARNNDLVVQTRGMGKRHAELRLQADGVHLRDLGSMSGCWVNRERIVDHGPLSDLDEISVGDVTILLSGSPRRDAGVSMATAAPQSDTHTDDDALGNEQAAARPRSVLRALGFGGARRMAEPEANSEYPGSAATDRTIDTSIAEAPAMYQMDAPKSSEAQPNEPTPVALAAASVDPLAATAEETRGDEQLAYWGAIVHEQLLYQMDLRRKDVNRMSDAELREESLVLIRSIIESLRSQLPETVDTAGLELNVLNESVGLGPLEQFLVDEDVTEIMVNSHQEIFVEKNGRLERSRFRFSSERTVYSVIERIITPLGRRIDESSPIVDARLKDGSRVNAIIPPLALKGPSLTIRKFPKHRLEFSDLVTYGSVDQAMVDFLRVCVDMRKNIIVSGGTGSGKTTLLNVLSNFIPDSDRIVTIEDAAELKLIQPNLGFARIAPRRTWKARAPCRSATWCETLFVCGQTASS